MPVPHEQRELAEVFRQWSEGWLSRAEFILRVFENLIPENVHELRSLASSDEIAMLMSASTEAPTTEEGWGEMRTVQSWCGPSTDELIGQMKRKDEEGVARYRRGIETLREYRE